MKNLYCYINQSYNNVLFQSATWSVVTSQGDAGVAQVTRGELPTFLEGLVRPWTRMYWTVQVMKLTLRGAPPDGVVGTLGVEQLKLTEGHPRHETHQLLVPHEFDILLRVGVCG